MLLLVAILLAASLALPLPAQTGTARPRVLFDVSAPARDSLARWWHPEQERVACITGAAVDVPWPGVERLTVTRVVRARVAGPTAGGVARAECPPGALGTIHTHVGGICTPSGEDGDEFRIGVPGRRVGVFGVQCAPRAYHLGVWRSEVRSARAP